MLITAWNDIADYSRRYGGRTAVAVFVLWLAIITIQDNRTTKAAASSPAAASYTSELYDSVSSFNNRLAMTYLLSPYTALGHASRDTSQVCATSELLANVDSDMPYLVERSRSAHAKCDLSRRIDAHTRHVFEVIAARQEFPLLAHEMQIFYQGADQGRWVKIGLFPSDQECREILFDAIAIGLGVKGCRHFKPSEGVLNLSAGPD